MQFKTILAALVCAATLAIPAAASATVFQDNGARDASAFTNVGPVFAEGTEGAGKYVWFVDRLAGEDILRGYDQSNPLATAQLATVNGNEDVGEGPIGSVSGLAFNPTQNLLYVADVANDRIIVYPRANDETANDPVNNMTAFSTYSFNPGFGVTDPKGIAIDTSDTYYGYASVKSSDDRRGLLVFNPTPSGNSLQWQKFVWDPSEWNSTQGPGTLAVDPVNGNIYAAIDGLGRVRGYTPNIDGLAGTFYSATTGDYNALAVDHDGNRLLAAKTGGIDVFSLRTSRLLGTATDTAFSQTMGLASLQLGGKYFLASSGASPLQDLIANPAPTCTPYAPLDVVADTTVTFTPSCTDADASTTLEFELLGETDIGTVETSNNDSAIDYYAFETETGPDAVSYRVTTQNGRSTTYSQPINVIEPDTTAPTVTITAPTDEATLDTTPTTLSFSVSDNRDPSPNCNFADGAQIPLDEGDNTITVSCTDASGNTGQDAVSFTYLPPDTEDPVATIWAPVDGSVTGSDSLEINFEVTDNRDPDPVCNYVYGEEILLSPGPNAITFSCEDASGNVGSDTNTVYYDNEDPEVTISAPSNGSVTGSATTTLQYSVSDDHDTAPSCDLADGEEIALDLGSNVITVICEDEVGNTGQASATVTYDAAAPAVEITSPLDSAILTGSSVVLNYTVDDDTDTEPSCNLANGGAVGLSVGSNTIVVSCTDSAGRTGSDSVTVTYDDEAPILEITAPSNAALITTSTTTLDFTISDDTDPAPSCNAISGSAVPLTVGSNTLTVSCTDHAGRAASQSVTVTYDAAAPVVEITEPTDGELVTSSELWVEYSVSDDTDTEPSCDAPSEDPYLLGVGINTIVVTCTDDAGRTGSDSIVVTYDADAPQITITAPANGSTTQSNQTALRYDVTDDTDSTPDCTRADGDSISLVPGANTITVSCTDDAEQMTSESVSVTYSPPVQAAAATEPFIRKTANLEPTTGEVLVKLPGSDKYVPLSEALLAPVGTIVDARKGTAKLTLANADGSTYEATFWGGIFQVFQGSGDNPVAIMKLRDDLIDEGVGAAQAATRAAANPFRAIQIAKRGKKKNGLWGNGKGKFKTSGNGGSATVRGTKWYVANYEGGTLFKVDRGIVNVRPNHGNCFDLKAGESKFIEYKPLTENQKKKKAKKKAKPKKGCT